MNPAAAVPDWALTLAYGLHLVGTVAWIGGLATLGVFVAPALRRVMSAQAYAVTLGKLHDRIQVVGWFSLALLAVTGLMQMSANPNYTGFLVIEGRWALAIFVKHLVIGGLVLTSAYQTWGVGPAFRRAALRIQRGLDAPDLAQLERRELWLSRANLALSLVILALTALARASS